MMHLHISKLGHHWFRSWLVTWPAQSHYLNQCWIIVNWTLGNIFQWHLNQNSDSFIQGNALKMLSAIWEPFCLVLNVLTHWDFVTHCELSHHWFIKWRCVFTHVMTLCLYGAKPSPEPMLADLLSNGPPETYICEFKSVYKHFLSRN